MRFNFFSTLSVAAVFAAQGHVAQAKYSEDEHEYDPMMFAQDKWDLGEDDTDLAQIWNSNLMEDYDFAQLNDGDYFAQTHNKGDSESESDAESDDDDSFTNLELAQQMQELNYLNALGTINAAQVQAMQNYGMQGMGMQGMQGMQGQMTPGSFAQIASEIEEDDDITARDLFLAQLAVTLAYLPDEHAESLENYLGQIEQAEESGETMNLAQTGVEVEDNIRQLATMFSQLDELELAQVSDILENAHEIFSDDIFAEVGTEEYQEMFDIVADFLSQTSAEDRKQIDVLLAQVKKGAYSDRGEILLPQTEGENEAKESLNEDLDAVAEFMAQLDDEELKKLNALAETKSQQNESEGASGNLSQIESLEGEEYDNYLF